MCGGSGGTCFCSYTSSFSDSWSVTASTNPSPSFIPSPSYQTSSSPYQWGEVTSTQDIAAANYIREFEEAYRGLPGSCHPQLQQQQLQNSFHAALGGNCQQQTEIFSHGGGAGIHLENDFFQPNEIFHLDQPLSSDESNRFETQSNRFTNPPYRFEDSPAELEAQYSRSTWKFTGSERLEHEKIEYDNPGGDYPDLYTVPPFSSPRANTQSFSFFNNYNQLEYLADGGEQGEFNYHKDNVIQTFHESQQKLELL